MRNINKVYLNTLFESQFFILLFKLHYYLATVAYVLQLLCSLHFGLKQHLFMRLINNSQLFRTDCI